MAEEILDERFHWRLIRTRIIETIAEQYRWQSEYRFFYANNRMLVIVCFLFEWLFVKIMTVWIVFLFPFLLIK